MKVLVVGCGPESEAAVIAAKLEHANIVFCATTENIRVGDYDRIIESHKIELNPKILAIPFIPKAKHLPKGYEHPYKYHR